MALTDHPTPESTVEGADLVAVERRQFRPERITVTYDWRTQLNDTDWSVRLVEVSGRWVAADGETPTGEGSGRVVLPPGAVPEWARHFVVANTSRTPLVER